MYAKDDVIRAISQANAACNNGRGSSVARSILDALRLGHDRDASLIYEMDGDKLWQYPILLQVIQGFLGCRAHGRTGCQSWLCLSLTGSLSSEVQALCDAALVELQPLAERREAQYGDFGPVLKYAIPRLKKGDWMGAYASWRCDADKYSCDDEGKAILKKALGCHVHGAFDCVECARR